MQVPADPPPALPPDPPSDPDAPVPIEDPVPVQEPGDPPPAPLQALS